MSPRLSAVRTLVVVLGDQLNADSAPFEHFDPALDAVWMAEVTAESTHVWSNKVRIAVFLAAMRHFRDDLRARGMTVHYTELKDGTLADELAAAVRALRPARVVVVEPGEYRLRKALQAAVPQLEILPDHHFFCSTDQFRDYASGRRQLRMEFFYRQLRAEHGVLMDGDQPLGGHWNYDVENRQSFGKSGPGSIPPPVAFPPDDTTRGVLDLVTRRFPAHPGRLDSFDWPVSRSAALEALADFIQHRLPAFGQFQDAMWTDEPWLYHSRISSSLNLKLLDPREVVAAAEAALHAGHAPLPAVEGFIRQILGWREYVRGIYWTFMPGYLDRNALAAHAPLPTWYWTGDCEMNCLRHALRQTLDRGYAHHIQRLMVTGLYALLLGVTPVEIHEWYLAVYVDAVEWVELPNVLGMSQYADGGLMASKPYIASGKYIQRMSNYCAGCRFDPAQSTGPDACPFTTLYWDFLIRHRARLTANPRTRMQVRNLDRLPPETQAAIQAQAAHLRQHDQ